MDEQTTFDFVASSLLRWWADANGFTSDHPVVLLLSYLFIRATNPVLRLAGRGCAAALGLTFGWMKTSQSNEIEQAVLADLSQARFCETGSGSISGQLVKASVDVDGKVVVVFRDCSNADDVASHLSSRALKQIKHAINQARQEHEVALAELKKERIRNLLGASKDKPINGKVASKSKA